MLFMVLLCNILFTITAYTNAKPVEFGETVFISGEDLNGEESHPYEVVVKSPQTSAMEVSDDDEYEETIPVKVVAVPFRPKLTRTRDTDLKASATDLQAAATGHGYGHGGHGGHGGHDNSGWLDMGAYSGGYGAFGWYADYPVGGGKGYGR